MPIPNTIQTGTVYGAGHHMSPSAGSWRQPEAHIEHRLHWRKAIRLPARLHFRDGGYIDGLAVNISEGGMFVRTAITAWREGCAEVRMRVRVGGCDKTVRLRAFIVHRNNGGLGLMFRDLDAEAKHIVAGLLAAQAVGSPCRGPASRRTT